jgi:hypothetical protein
MARVGFSLLFVGLAALVGCSAGDANLPELVPVSGTVTLDDKPLAKATVTFIPVGTTRGDGGFATTDENGRYQLLSLQRKPGAPVGAYRVVISKRVMPDGSDVPDESDVAPIDSPAREMLPPQYSSEQDSTLSATVPEGGGTIDFPLTSAP